MQGFWPLFIARTEMAKVLHRSVAGSTTSKPNQWKVPAAQEYFTFSYFMSHISFQMLSSFALNSIKVRSMIWAYAVKSAAHMSL